MALGFSYRNKANEKHAITYTSSTNELVIIRLRACGGVPKTIRVVLEDNQTFAATMKKVSVLCELDDDYYDIL